MIQLNEKPTASQIIPDVETSLFDDRPDARFAIGIIAVGNEAVPGRESEFKSYALLRGHVYGWEKNFTAPNLINTDGSEKMDSDDARSVHFAIIENAVTNPRVIGAMRLIIKSREHDEPLPVEEHYPEAFGGVPATLLSTEVSRVITRHEDQKVQRTLSLPLFAAGVSYVMNNRLGPVYGAVAGGYPRLLRMQGVPNTALLNKAKFIEEYNATKLPIRIDTTALANNIEAKQPDLFDGMRASPNGFIYTGVVPKATEDSISVQVA